MYRFIFPIARPALSASELERDVPRLSNRQFVVDRSGRTEGDVLAERRQFWSRQALMENVKAWWGIVGCPHNGIQGNGLIRPDLFRLAWKREDWRDRTPEYEDSRLGSRSAAGGSFDGVTCRL